jgi:hypothetical protein
MSADGKDIDFGYSGKFTFAPKGRVNSNMHDG